MGTEQQPSRAQGTPEEIRGAEERVTSLNLPGQAVHPKPV